LTEFREEGYRTDDLFSTIFIEGFTRLEGRGVKVKADCFLRFRRVAHSVETNCIVDVCYFVGFHLGMFSTGHGTVIIRPTVKGFYKAAGTHLQETVGIGMVVDGTGLVFVPT